MPASFSLTASVIMAEIISSRKDHEVKGAVQARPFQLCHMRQVESVCVRATNPVHSALAAWVALLAHAGLRAEDSQRLKVGSCGFTDVAIHGVCRNPKPRGVSNMPCAALRCGVLDEDCVGQSFVNVNAPGLPRAPSGAIGFPRTPTGKPILFGHCAPHPGAFGATSNTETCRRQPHVRSPSASENRFSECGTSAQAAVFQVHSRRYSDLP